MLYMAALGPYPIYVRKKEPEREFSILNDSLKAIQILEIEREVLYMSNCMSIRRRRRVTQGNVPVYLQVKWVNDGVMSR